MDLRAFYDELAKMAELTASQQKARQQVRYFHSPKPGEWRWNYLMQHVGSPEFRDQMMASRRTDELLARHVDSLHQLVTGKVLDAIESSKGRGLRYEIKQLADGRLGCTCNDWRYVGSVHPGYECKHIRQFRQNAARAA